MAGSTSCHYPSRKKMTNIAVFVSGSGTNCENIIRYFADSDTARVALVVSNKADAYALVRAGRLGVPTAVLSKSELSDEQKVNALMDAYGIGFVVLAGFLLMVPDFLIRRYGNRMVNIHPALLPKYGGKGMYGHHVHEAVKAAGETESGITIHYVNDVCDGGSIIFQARTPISPSDTPDDIAAKIHELEQAHYPRVIEETIRRHAIEQE